MSVRPWLPGETRQALKAHIDGVVRGLVPPPPNPDSVRRRAYRQEHIEQERAWEQGYRQRRRELERARRAAARAAASGS